MPHKDLEARRANGRARAKRYHDRHREKLRIKSLNYHALHREEDRLYAQEYYELNRAEENARSRTYYAEHTEEILAQKKGYRLENAEKLSAYGVQYRTTRPDVIVMGSARRRARKRAAPLNDLTTEQWREIQEAFDHRCAYCGKRAKGHLTQDHITPLSKGGSHTAPNVIPACKSCNSRKHDGPPLKPVQPLLVTVAPSRKPKKVS